jgi:hypothetical protein
MKASGIFLVGLLAILFAGQAVASGFEFCDLEGSIRSIAEPTKGEYELSVRVVKSSRAKENGRIGDTDCHEHTGQALRVAFTAAELPRAPAVGDYISFSQSVSVIDGTGNDGAFLGTSVNTHLHSLRKQGAAAGR